MNRKQRCSDCGERKYLSFFQRGGIGYPVNVCTSDLIKRGFKSLEGKKYDG